MPIWLIRVWQDFEIEAKTEEDAIAIARDKLWDDGDIIDDWNVEGIGVIGEELGDE